ncbi:hypothetical protein [Streptomyces sp. NPDC048584]|uniref:hypothetical protein n=1 Tax=Streptomyces sp. NPDC048584 TaxID=3365573 RepID=UPI00370FCAB9
MNGALGADPGAGGVKGAPGAGEGTGGGTGIADGPPAPTACGGGVSPGNGGIGPPDEGAGAGAEGEDGGVSEEPEEADGPPGSGLPEAFCVYQAGGA